MSDDGEAFAVAAADTSVLLSQAAVVPDALSLIWVRGTDAVSFLDGMVSQSVAGGEAGSVRRSFLLTPQGKMRALLWIIQLDPSTVGLITQRTTEKIVIDDLTRFRFRVDAAIELESRPTATMVGPEAAAMMRAAAIDVPAAGWAAAVSGLVVVVPFITGGLPRYLLAGEMAVAMANAAPVAQDAAYQSVRISLGEPLGSIDFDDGTISHELGPVDEAVDFTKGCYLGQELVARIDSRGRVNQTLRTIRASREVQLSGAVLTAGDREVGTVTSAALAPDGQSMIGLARVRREVEDGQVVAALCDGRHHEVTIEAIVAATDH